MFLHPPHTTTRLSARYLRRFAAVPASVALSCSRRRAAAVDGSTPNQGASVDADAFAKRDPSSSGAGRTSPATCPR